MAARRTTPQVATTDPSDVLSIEVEVGGKKKTLRFKSFALMPMGILRVNRNNELGMIWDGFEWALSAADLAVLDGLPSSKIYTIWNAMQVESRANVGESSASSTS